MRAAPLLVVFMPAFFFYDYFPDIIPASRSLLSLLIPLARRGTPAPLVGERQRKISGKRMKRILEVIETNETGWDRKEDGWLRDVDSILILYILIGVSGRFMS